MRGVEYWVMRIAVVGGADFPTWSKSPHAETIVRGLKSGKYQVIGDDICEPIECHDTRQSAELAMLREWARHRVPHKIIMSADIVLNADQEMQA